MGSKIRRSIQQILLQSYEDVRVTQVAKVKDLDYVVARRPDLVFLGASRIGNGSTKEVVWLSSYFEQRGLACTNSESVAHDIERNKVLAKQKVTAKGFKSPRSIAVDQENGVNVIRHDLKYPLFVKPVNKGGGIGIDDKSYVTSHHELEAKVRSIAHEHQTDSLVEEYLPGREFSVAILYDDQAREYRAMPIELQSDENDEGVSMLSYQVKLSDSERVLKVDDAELADYIKKQALGMFEAIGGRDYGRVDVRLDANGEANFLEANLFPSLTEGYGSFPKACLINAGLSQPDIINTIARLGLRRSRTRV